MKFNVNQQDLQQALNYCQGVIEKRSTLPILSNILLDAQNKKLTNRHTMRLLGFQKPLCCSINADDPQGEPSAPRPPWGFLALHTLATQKVKFGMIALSGFWDLLESGSQHELENTFGLQHLFELRFVLFIKPC